MSKVKGSETVFIKRSQINLNPYNPKNHTDEQIKLQKRNIKEVGYLGGIIWNEASSNLLDGHRRVQALDLIYRYDGTDDTDYDIKVEKVVFDDKTEKEQMTYQAIGNSQADYNLIAEYIDDIDHTKIGISDDQYNAIKQLSAELETMYDGMETIEDEFISSVTPDVKPTEERGYDAPPFQEPVREAVHELRTDTLTNDDIVRFHEEKPKMTREEVRAQKEHCDDVATKTQGKQDLYVVVSFKDENTKAAFCEALGFDMANNMVIDGEDLLNRFDL